MSPRHQPRGQCFLCDREMAKGGLTRHIKKHLGQRPGDTDLIWPRKRHRDPQPQPQALRPLRPLRPRGRLLGDEHRPLCETHAEGLDETGPLPIVNSPHTGLCGYNGPYDNKLTFEKVCPPRAD